MFYSALYTFYALHKEAFSYKLYLIAVSHAYYQRIELRGR